MIRTLHHMADAPGALSQVRKVMQPGSVFILEFASKLNLKSILRYVLGRQRWSPFSLEPVEFVELNFDFHPRAVRGWLQEIGFSIEKILTVSHFRLDLLKKIIPTGILVSLDALAQWTGPLWQLTPSVFVRARATRDGSPRYVPDEVIQWFRCPQCGSTHLEDHSDFLQCPSCSSRWQNRDGIYDFREPVMN